MGKALARISLWKSTMVIAVFRGVEIYGPDLFQRNKLHVNEMPAV